MSNSATEYKQITRLLGNDGSIKSVLDDTKISQALLEQGVTKLANQNEIFLLHDPSDIRKEYSTALEDLGQVLDLKKNVIKGYSSFNTIALDLHGKQLTLLDTEIYSNATKNYVTEAELDAQKQPCISTASEEDCSRYNEVKRLVASNEYINHKKIAKEQLRTTSGQLKNHSVKTITHIADRQFDDMEFLDFINHELHDQFVIRMKVSRVSSDKEIIEGKICTFSTVPVSAMPYMQPNCTIINNNICYDNKISKANKIGKIIYCKGNISEFLAQHDYKKNQKLTKVLPEILQDGAPSNAGNIVNWYKTYTQKEAHTRLVNKIFPNVHTYHYPKIAFKNKTYQDVTVNISWGYQINDYQAVKIDIKTRDGNNIFKQPMLLITNKIVESDQQALNIYHIYLKRSKIEGVFKFLKDVLGWEESQLRKFNAIKNLLTFCYFVAGYFYEIESALINEVTVRAIAFFGGGKGKVTRKFILEGLSKLIIKKQADDWIVEYGITPEQLLELYALAGLRIK